MLLIVSALTFVFLSRVLWSIFTLRSPQRSLTSTAEMRTLVVLGSGGHTSEMLTLISHLPSRYTKNMTCIVADSDVHSQRKLKMAFGEEPTLLKIPRAREVGQSYVSSIFTTLRAFLSAFLVVSKESPDLILCNGPGTCLPIVYSAFLLRVLGLRYIHVVFVESFCRVKTLSLCGKLVYPVCSLFFVQWQDLQSRYPQSKYIGLLV